MDIHTFIIQARQKDYFPIAHQINTDVRFMTRFGC